MTALLKGKGAGLYGVLRTIAHIWVWQVLWTGPLWVWIKYEIIFSHRLTISVSFYIFFFWGCCKCKEWKCIFFTVLLHCYASDSLFWSFPLFLFLGLISKYLTYPSSHTAGFFSTWAVVSAGCPITVIFITLLASKMLLQGWSQTECAYQRLRGLLIIITHLMRFTCP